MIISLIISKCCTYFLNLGEKKEEKISKKEAFVKIAPNFLIRTLGCKVNQYDSAVLRRELIKRGFLEFREDFGSSFEVRSRTKIKNKTGFKAELKPEPNFKSLEPDLIVVNTCTVTNKAISKDKHLIKELRKKFPSGRLVVMGCWPETDETAIKSFSDKEVIFWGTGKIEALADKLKEGFNLSGIFESNFLAATDRSRYFLKIGDGCNQFCSYCLIPFARGRLKSRKSSELIKEAKLALDNGYREIILSGIHLGRYGENKNGQEINLSALIKKFLEIKNLGKIRLSSIEIDEVSDELIDLINKESKICRHLHISLQSGSDKILEAMRRPYDSKFFNKRIKVLRKKVPGIAITTDIIVGFPGEGEKEFKETYNFAKKVAFSKIHVFSYSEHKKTLASKLKDKVNQQDIKNRSKILRELSSNLENSYQEFIFKKYKNKELSFVLIKNPKKGGKYRLLSEFSFEIELTKKDLEKALVKQGQRIEDLKAGQLVSLVIV